MRVFGLVLATGVATILLASSTAKLGRPLAFSNTLYRLGVPRLFERVAAIGLPAAELGASALITLRVVWPAGPILVALLGTLFGVAGAVAARSGRQIPCACFGSSSQTLGWRHVALIPFWWLSAFVMFISSWSSRTGVILLSGALLATMSLRTVEAMTGSRSSRGDRLAIAEQLS